MSKKPLKERLSVEGKFVPRIVTKPSRNFGTTCSASPTATLMKNLPNS